MTGITPFHGSRTPRLRQIREDLESDKVFDVIGDVFPANLLEKMFRAHYAGRMKEAEITERVLSELDAARIRDIAHSTLEGLAKRELNLSAIVGRTAEAKERRLVPEVIEDFARQASTLVHLPMREEKAAPHVYRVGKVPPRLLIRGAANEKRFGVLAKEYGRIVFDKKLLADDATVEWVTPGHALFEALRADLSDKVADDLRRGAVFYDLQTKDAYRLDVFVASVNDGRGHSLHKRLFVVRAGYELASAPLKMGQLHLAVTPPTQGSLPLAQERRLTLSVRQPTIFLDLIPAKGIAPPVVGGFPNRAEAEAALFTQALQPWVEEVRKARERESDNVRDHVQISLNELINRAQVQLGDLQDRVDQGDSTSGLAGLMAQAESHVEELNQRLERRLAELDMERLCTVADIEHIGQAWVLPHPDRNEPEVASMVSDADIERVAVEKAVAYEQSLGWEVTSVEAENRGYDLLSRKPHPTEAGAFDASRFIEVKGRAGVGEVALSSNEFKTATRLGDDYFLYVVFNCASTPELHTIQNPVRLGWKPVVRVEHYHATVSAILGGATDDTRTASDGDRT